MKTKEELSALKAEFETVKSKLAELTEEEMAEVAGGSDTLKEETRKLGGVFAAFPMLVSFP